MSERDDRLDEQLNQLLQELRVMLPGVEILFAFLLTAPFSDRFEQLPGHSKALYVVTLASSALAIGLFIAPPALHRIQGRGREKEHLIKISTRLAIAGMGFLALAITTGAFIVVDFVHGLRLGSSLAAALGLFLVFLWYFMPYRRRHKLDKRERQGRSKEKG